MTIFIILQEILLATCLPQIWPDDIAKVLKNADLALSKLQRQFMIRTITERTIQNGFSAAEFLEVAEFALKQIPHLRSKVIKGSVSIKWKLWFLNSSQKKSKVSEI